MKLISVKLVVIPSFIFLTVVCIIYVSHDILSGLKIHELDGCQYLNCTYEQIDGYGFAGFYVNYTLNNTNYSYNYYYNYCQNSWGGSCQYQVPANNTPCYLTIGAAAPFMGNNCKNYEIHNKKNNVIVNIILISFASGLLFITWIIYELLQSCCSFRSLYEEIPDLEEEIMLHKTPENTSCSICLVDFQSEDKYYECRNCKNNFHYDCLLMAIMKSNRKECLCCTVQMNNILCINSLSNI